jgi:hypothetical protein
MQEKKGQAKNEVTIAGDLKGVGNTGDNTTINQYINQPPSTEENTNNEDQLLEKAKEVLKNIDIKRLKKIAYQYLPRSYFASLPNAVNEIIDHLLSIGALKNCVPILSIFENLESQRHHHDLKAFIDYLKDIKYKEKSLSCIENKAVSELSLLIYFSAQDGENTFVIETWRYENGETYNVSLGENLSSIDLNDSQQLALFLDIVDAYLEEIDLLIDKNNVYIEIIMPNHVIYSTIKQWKNSKGKRLIRKYKYIFRMQARFKNPDNTWINKWETLNITVNNAYLNDQQQSLLIEEKDYDEHIVAENYSVILQEKINNPRDLFEDIDDFGIPIVLSSLSEECNIEELKSIAFKECQQKICSHIMRNHKDYKSDLFFMVDDPNKIPEEFKNPEPNLYGW